MLTGRPFKLVNVRAGRKDPGLRPSHVMSVKAAAQICGGSYKGASVGSSTLSFEPGQTNFGIFGIGTHRLQFLTQPRNFGTGVSQLLMRIQCVALGQIACVSFIVQFGFQTRDFFVRAGY